MPYTNGKADTIPVVSQLRSFLEALEQDTSGRCHAITIITQDGKTGTMSISSLTEAGFDEKHTLFADMAQALGFGKLK